MENMEGIKVQAETSAMAVVMCHGKILATTEIIYGKEALSLPKGHVEENETPFEAAVRECYEETNVTVSASEMVGELTHFTYEFLTPSNKHVKKTLIPYLFETESFGDPLPKEERMVSVKWMDTAEFLQSCTYENVRNTLIEALNRG